MTGERPKCQACGYEMANASINGMCVTCNMRRGLAVEPKEAVNHPSHYGGAENPYEAIKVIRAWELGFSLGNTVKYISRAGKKDPAKTVEDLKKAAWYLAEEIAFLEKGGK